MLCCPVLHWTETVPLQWMDKVDVFCRNTDGDLSDASAVINCHELFSGTQYVNWR